MTYTSEITKRVLAIDDDETILSVMNNVLRMHDYEAITATQWVEALEALEERTPDLLLLDLQMPHVDGFFLLEWIREQEITLPVIVVSAYLDDESMDRLRNLGVDEFIWKPFNVGDLVTAIEKKIGSGVSVTEPPVGEEGDSEVEANEGEEAPVRRRRVRRRRRGTKKRHRRRMAIYLSAIAILSLGISGVSIYIQNMASRVDVSTQSRTSSPTDETQLLKELLRVQIESSLQQQGTTAPAPKKLDLNLPRK